LDISATFAHEEEFLRDSVVESNSLQFGEKACLRWVANFEEVVRGWRWRVGSDGLGEVFENCTDISSHVDPDFVGK
jgi:hypothetical protein